MLEQQPRTLEDRTFAEAEIARPNVADAIETFWRAKYARMHHAMFEMEKLAEKAHNEGRDRDESRYWNIIAGLQIAKQILEEKP